jgi:hypothetical protein
MSQKWSISGQIFRYLKNLFSQFTLTLILLTILGMIAISWVLIVSIEKLNTFTLTKKCKLGLRRTTLAIVKELSHEGK